MTDRELLQQALDALKMSYELQDNGLINFEEYKLISDADILIKLNITIEAIRTRLAQPEPEPVAWMHNFIDYVITKNRPTDITRNAGRWTPLYTAPPAKEWAGLTDEEISELIRASHNTGSFVRVIEAKLKEKNT